MTTDTTTKTFEGYQVAAQEPGSFAYLLTGPKGGTIGLMRYNERPEILWPINGRTMKIMTVKGWRNLTDKDGVLKGYN